MQPNEEQHSPETKPRKRRKSHSSLHEGEGEGWAVSYSDMLMVILSFFIIFYNTEEGKGETAGAVESLVHQLRLDQLSLEIDPVTGQVVDKKVVAQEPEQIIPGFPKGTGTEEKKVDELSRKIASFFSGKKKKQQGGFGKKEGLGSGENMGDDVGIKDELDGVTFTMIEPKKTREDGKWNRILKQTNDPSAYKGGILIDFKDDLYGRGSVDLSIKAMAEIKRVLDLVKPYEKKLNIVFIGHTDSIPFKGSRGMVNSNMILSSLRAAKAVEFAIDRGFDHMWVSSQGLSKHVRNTRSLSIRIMER